ncbi:MAG: hypothetical protein R3F54_29610 [Alphaproteobacteria bacterium]
MLVIYDAAQNLLSRETIPVGGETPLDVVLREGMHGDVAGVFVKINNTIRFAPWSDLSADPRGLRYFSDSFIQTGELTLRITKAPCGGRLPLMLQLRELQPTIQALASKAEAPVTRLAYRPLGNWADTGLFLPDQLRPRIDDRWDDPPCQPGLSLAAAIEKQHALTAASHQMLSVDAPLNVDERPKATTLTRAVAKADRARPCRLCRSSDDHGENAHDHGHDKGMRW